MPRASRKKKTETVDSLDAALDLNMLRSLQPVMADSYQNVPARIGNGTPNLVNSGNYPLVRLTEQYPLILSLYRSSWIVRKIIDQVANDVFKVFPVLDFDVSPEQVSAFRNMLLKTRTITRLRSLAKWGRLFGGAGAIMVLDGHDDLRKPLDVDDVQVGAYKGLIVLDRWSGIIPGPEINSDINDPESFGLPTYYNCIMDAGNVTVHHSRVLRFTGRELPQWEVQVELYWGMSEVEVIFDELKKRDYSSWNIVSLLTRAQVMALSEPQLATMMSGAGTSNDAFNMFVNRMEMISQQLNNNGLLILGKDGKLENKSYGFGGVSDVYREFMKDLAAATGIPYEVIFGRNQGMGGEMGNNGGASLQLYDNMIEEKRISEANPVIDKLLPVMCMSIFGKVPEDLVYHWTPIRALTEKERYDLAKSAVESVLMAYNADLLTKKEARTELATGSGTHGLFNLPQEAVAATPDLYASEAMLGAQFDPDGNDEDTVGGVSVGEDPPDGTPGARSGEQVPVEAKPVGVKGLIWHKSRRLTEGPGGAASKGSAGTNSSSTTKSLHQSMQHSVKHETKKPKR